ncbi:hypothetical protein ACXYTP_24410 [Tsukamurella ocularis]|uniref:hypothetical protein n=1 Tax=Tsukamurella ocularis TaxID=1970234 RepID=UPI0039EFA609
MRGTRIAAGWLVVAAVLTACGDRSAPPTETSRAAGGSVSTGTSAATSSTAPPRDLGPIGPTAAAAHGYVPGSTRVSGSDRAVTYDVEVPTLSDGSASVTARFTTSIRASLDDRVRELGGAPRPVTLARGSLANGEGSRVSRIGLRSVAGILLTNYFMQGAAHPNNQIGTVVINTDTAQPILLSQLLPTPDATARVKELIREQATADGPTLFLNESTTLANWLPTDAGITFYVPVAHAAGDFRPFALPWSDLADIVPADVRDVLRA